MASNFVYMNFRKGSGGTGVFSVNQLQNNNIGENKESAVYWLLTYNC